MKKLFLTLLFLFVVSNLNAENFLSFSPISLFDDNNNAYYISTTKLEDNKYAVVYAEQGGVYRGKVVIATVSGTTVTYGAEYEFSTGSADNITAATLSSGKIVIAYRDGQNSGYGTALVAEISGTTVSFGSKYEFNTGNTQVLNIATVSESKFAVAFTDIDNSNYGTAVVGTVSGTVISFGSEFVYNSEATSSGAITSPSDSKIAIAYDADANNYGTLIVGTISGTDISFGSAYAFNSASTSNITADVVSSDKCIIAYADGGNSGYMTTIIGTISGTDVSYGSEYATTYNTSTIPNISVNSDSDFILAFKHDTKGRLVHGNISGTTIDYKNSYLFSQSQPDYLSLESIASDKMIINYYNRYAKVISILSEEASTAFMGGSNDGYSMGEKLLYTDSWVNKTGSPSGRDLPATARFEGTDKVLLFGGFDGSNLLDETWIYDLSDDNWTQLNPGIKPSARYTRAMSYIGDDKILLFGGYDGNNDDETWIYDLSDGNWTQLNPGNKPSARRWHSMSYIGDDKVLLFGGFDGGNDDETWIYDLSDANWTQLNPVNKPSARNIHAMSFIGDDKVILFGGADGNFDDETWIYDLSDANWTQMNPANKPSARGNHSLSYMGDDKVILFGGWDSGTYNDETWLYDLSDANWTQLSPANKPSARQTHSLSYIGDDKVILFGGNDGSVKEDTWVYDLSDDNWTDVTPEMPSGRYFAGMSYAGDDKALLFGGNAGGYSDETWVYDLSDGIWTQQNPSTKPSARQTHRTSYICDDKVLLFGGYDVSRDDETWVYDLSDGTWTQQNPGTKPSARQYHSMSYIGDDKVLLFGGSDGSQNDETWVYDLSDGTWTQQNPGTKPSARSNHSMSYIGDDKVLLFGGYDGSQNDETWVFDLSDGTWTQQSPGTNPNARNAHSISYIGDDKVLLFGGYDGSNYYDDTWIYDLSEDFWAKRNPAIYPSERQMQASVSFWNGTVMIHGGSDGSEFSDYWTYSEASVPTLTTTAISSITSTSASSGGNITDAGGATVTASGIVYATTSSPEVGGGGVTNVATSPTTETGAFTSALSSLSAETEYFVRAYATTTEGTGYGNEVSFFTYSNPATIQASNFQATITTAEQIDLSWDAATFPASGATVKNYLLIRAEGANNPVLTSSNGEAPAVDGNTTIVSQAIAEATTTFNNSGLTAGTQYNYMLIPFTWDGTNPETYNYLTASAPTVSETAVELPTVTTTAFSNLAKTAFDTGGNVTADGSGSVSARGVVVGTASGATVSSNDFITTDGTGTGVFTSNVTGLSAATTYYVRAYATNEVGTAYGSEIEVKTLPNPATSVTFDNITGNSFRINWTRGNGNGVVVFLKQAENGTATPVDGTDYTANTTFGSGSEIATGWFCVYDNTGNNVTVTNLNTTNTYVAQVFEYVSFTGNNFKYNAETASGNPGSTGVPESWVSDDYSEGNPAGFGTTHFSDLDLAKSKTNTGGIINITNYTYDGNVDLSGYTVIIGLADFEITNGTYTGQVQTPSTGKLVLPTSVGGTNTYPLSDGSTGNGGDDGNFTIEITPDAPTVFNVKITPRSEVPSGTGMLSNTLFEIETEAVNPTADIVFTIPDASIQGGTLPENVIFRYWDADENRYKAIDANKVTIVDHGTYYTVTITNVNKF